MNTGIALIGPGSIGGAIAAHLSAGVKRAVDLAVRTPIAQLTLELPDGNLLSAQPDCIANPTQARSGYDWVLICTKAYDADATTAWLRALAGAHTRVAILQNGVEHVARFSHVIPADRLLPVMVELPAERLAPGRIRQRGPGMLRVPAGMLGDAFVSLFTGSALDVAAIDDFISIAWRKLALNAPGAVNALLQQPNGAVKEPAIAQLLHDMAAEVLAVARAEGATLPDELPAQIVEFVRRAAPDGVNSILADRLAGRRMEADARNGAVVRAGQRHGIATPLNAMALALLEAQQPSA